MVFRRPEETVRFGAPRSLWHGKHTFLPFSSSSKAVIPYLGVGIQFICRHSCCVLHFIFFENTTTYIWGCLVPSFFLGSKSLATPRGGFWPVSSARLCLDKDWGLRVFLNIVAPKNSWFRVWSPFTIQNAKRGSICIVGSLSCLLSKGNQRNPRRHVWGTKRRAHRDPLKDHLLGSGDGTF